MDHVVKHCSLQLNVNFSFSENTYTLVNIKKSVNRKPCALLPLRTRAKNFKQADLMAQGLRDDEVLVLSKESQVQRVVRQCKVSHGGPIHSVKELEELIKKKPTEKALTSALNYEIRYRKFTCLLKVATNNELFKQQGIDNKQRIIHLKQLLNNDTKPKCHASMSDIEAIYEQPVNEESIG